jgi:hypothetical protein
MQVAERLPEVRESRLLRFVARHEPYSVLVPLVAAQWLALVGFVLTVRHNGWLFYQGGDQTFYYTTSWLLSDWTMPTTPIGYGWSYLTAPIALFTDQNLLNGLPGIILLQTVVLLPVALLCVYGIAARIGGRILGYAAAALWVAAPYAAIEAFDQRYHQKYVELFLPQALGLTGLADFPSMVCLLVAAYFGFRALDSDDWRDGALCGLAAGFACGIKPANGVFVAAPLVAFLIGRRWRQLLPFAAALVPPLVALAVWKQRGLGANPALALGDGELAFASAALAPLASLFDPLTKYIHFDWDQFTQNRDVMREFFWSVRPLDYLPFAGAIALARRSLPKAALVFVWWGGYLLVKGASPIARVEDGSFFRLVMPAFPAFFLLTISIPLLVPTLGPKLWQRFPAPEPRRISLRPLAAGFAIFALIPLIVVAAVSPQRGPVAVNYYDQGVFLPVSPGDLKLTAEPEGRAYRLRWQQPDTNDVGVFYRVFRVPAVRPDLDPFNAPPVIRGVNCQYRKFAPGADDCRLTMDSIGLTHARTWKDEPGPGRWTYRVGLSANWLDDQNLGDVLMLSGPVTVRARR